MGYKLCVVTIKWRKNNDKTMYCTWVLLQYFSTWCTVQYFLNYFVPKNLLSNFLFYFFCSNPFFKLEMTVIWTPSCHKMVRRLVASGIEWGRQFVWGLRHVYYWILILSSSSSSLSPKTIYAMLLLQFAHQWNVQTMVGIRLNPFLNISLDNISFSRDRLC